MPALTVERSSLFKAIGEQFSEESFDELCFEFGVELDEVVKETENNREVVKYKIDIPANRYDLLCLEGLSRALRIFLGKSDLPLYKRIKAASAQRILVRSSVAEVRPFVVAAVLRGITFTQARYDSFIDLQDKLHQNLCRKRALVAIGTHDLDTIQGPFVYEARSPQEIRFRALNQQKELTAVELMELYSTDSHLKSYLPIIRDKPRYPLISDSKGIVLSMPPIINGEHSKITLETKNVLIESTATQLARARIVLDTLVTMFSEYCSNPFEVEVAEVEYPDGRLENWPSMKYRKEIVSVSGINRDVGIDVSGERMASLLKRMSLEASLCPDQLHIEVQIPPTRHDILHACDIMEDVGIAYGFNNIERRLPEFGSLSEQVPLNALSDKVREEVALMGFTEAAPFTLCSREDVADKLRLELSTVPVVYISNPKTLEFQVCRSTLLPGLLKTIASNKNVPLPIRLFEVSDVILKDGARDVGARNERRICLVNYNKSPEFELIHGALDRLFLLLEIPYDASKEGKGYYLRASACPTYFPGRCAEVLVNGRYVGHVGVLHPEVLAKFDLSLPVAALEMNLEIFL